MRIAIISAVSSEGTAASALLQELTLALRRVADVDASLWFVFDGPQQNRAAWEALGPHEGGLYLLELQAQQTPCRALTTALAYLACERDEQFDGYVLLEGFHPRDVRSVGALIENSFLHPGAVVFGQVKPSTLSWRRRFTRGWHGLLTRGLSGQRLENSTLTFLPGRAAEALAHSCHASSHLEAALRRMKLTNVCTPAVRGDARPASSLSLLEGLSVFREAVFARAFTASSLLGALSFAAAGGLTAWKWADPEKVSTAALTGAWALPLALAIVACASLLLGLGAQALNESRRWTPALDCTLLVRMVRRVKRGPEAIAN